MNSSASVDPVLMAALDPVLSDLGRTAGVPLTVKTKQWSDFPGQATVMIVEPDGTGTGISVMVQDEPAERILAVADQVQDIVVEALWGLGRSATWPECPEHKASHPLKAERTDAGPMWLCPASRAGVAVIGSLGLR